MRRQGKQAAVERRTGHEERRDEVEVDADAFALHDHCVAHFAILASRLPDLATGAEVRVSVLHDERHQQLGLRARGDGDAAIRIGDTEIAARKVTLTMSGATFELHFDARRRLLRWWQQCGEVEVTLRQP